MKNVRKWITEDGKEFDTKADAARHELGGENADMIARYLDSLPPSERGERGEKASRTRATKAIAGFLSWKEAQEADSEDPFPLSA